MLGKKFKFLFKLLYLQYNIFFKISIVFINKNKKYI
jgi:hypothetical protein